MSRPPRTVNERLDRLEHGMAALRAMMRAHTSAGSYTEVVGFRPEDADEVDLEVEDAAIEPIGRKRAGGERHRGAIERSGRRPAK